MAMAELQLFRILTPNGALSDDTFAVAPRQPENVKADCLLVVDEATGERLTVHATRLFPVEVRRAAAPAATLQSVCLECGRVSGVVEEEVHCPHHEDGIFCDLLRAQPE